MFNTETMGLFNKAVSKAINDTAKKIIFFICFFASIFLGKIFEKFLFENFWQIILVTFTPIAFSAYLLIYKESNFKAGAYFYPLTIMAIPALIYKSGYSVITTAIIIFLSLSISPFIYKNMKK